MPDTPDRADPAPPSPRSRRAVMGDTATTLNSLGAEIDIEWECDAEGHVTIAAFAPDGAGWHVGYSGFARSTAFLDLLASALDSLASDVLGNRAWDARAGATLDGREHREFPT
jgi:hypothetical protein